MVALGLFELMCWGAFTHTPLRDTRLRPYFWYGESQEARLRALVATPDLPPDSILHVGWLDPAALAVEPRDADVSIYGSSFADNLADAMREVRPDLKVRMVGAPGAPLNHTYAMYQLDRGLRKTKVAVLTVVSENVANVLSMNNGTLLTDNVAPYFYPRYDLVDGRVQRSAAPVINSSAELARAFREPALWGEQLALMEAHDDAYVGALFRGGLADHSVIGRLLRRAASKSHQSRHTDALLGARGFDRDAYATRVLRALLHQLVADVRAEGAQPVVVLFSTRKHSDFLGALLGDQLVADGVPFVHSYDVCPSTDPRNYVADGHFTDACDREFARRVLALAEGRLKEVNR